MDFKRPFKASRGSWRVVWRLVWLVMATCATVAHGGRAKESIALSRTEPVAPVGVAAVGVAPVGVTRGAVQSAQLALVVSCLKAAIVGFTPAEQWLRRFVGGGRKQQQIWSEYCRERDQLIMQVGASPTGRDLQLKAVILERLVLDLRTEFKSRYPAWAILWE
jgi:hypothetical protein